MPTSPLTVFVDADAAEAFSSASAEDQKKIQLLLGLRLRELVDSENVSLREVVDRLGEKAEERGLTPEILESILHDK